MRRFHRDPLTDEAAERLLSGVDADSAIGAVARELREAGPTPPSEAAAARHVAAIVAEAQRPAEALIAPPRRRGGRAALATLIPVRPAACATAFAAMLALTFAGALPGPVQAAASDVLGVVGISVPDGRGAADRSDETPAPAIKRPGRPIAPATLTLPGAVDDVTPPRVDDDPAEAPRRDQTRPYGELNGDDDRGREDHGDRDDDRRPSPQREPDDDEAGAESDEDTTSGSFDADGGSGSDGEPRDSGDEPELDSFGFGESGDEPDAIDELEDSSEGRSGADDPSIGDVADEPDDE